MEAFQAGLPGDLRMGLGLIKLYEVLIEDEVFGVPAGEDYRRKALIVAEVKELKLELRRIVDDMGRRLAERVRFQPESDSSPFHPEGLRAQGDALVVKIGQRLDSLKVSSATPWYCLRGSENLADDSKWDS